MNSWVLPPAAELLTAPLDESQCVRLRARVTSALKRSLFALLEAAKGGLGEPLAEELALIASVDEHRRVAPHLFALNDQLHRALEAQDVDRVQASLRHLRELSPSGIYREALSAGADLQDPWEAFLLEELRETLRRRGSTPLTVELSERDVEQARRSIQRAIETLEGADEATGNEVAVLLAEVVFLGGITGGLSDSRLYGRAYMGLDPGETDAAEYFAEQIVKAASWHRLSALEMLGARLVEPRATAAEASPEAPRTRELISAGLALARLVRLDQGLATRSPAEASRARLQRHEEEFMRLFDELVRRQDLTGEGRVAVTALWEMAS
jgi:hypothetical protein